MRGSRAVNRSFFLCFAGRMRPAAVTRLPSPSPALQCWPAFPSVPALGSTGSAADGSSLFVGFTAPTAGPDFSCPAHGSGSWPSALRHRLAQAKVGCATGPNRVFPHAHIMPPTFLPSRRCVQPGFQRLSSTPRDPGPLHRDRVTTGKTRHEAGPLFIARHNRRLSRHDRPALRIDGGSESQKTYPFLVSQTGIVGLGGIRPEASGRPLALSASDASGRILSRGRSEIRVESWRGTEMVPQTIEKVQSALANGARREGWTDREEVRVRRGGKVAMSEKRPRSSGHDRTASMDAAAERVIPRLWRVPWPKWARAAIPARVPTAAPRQAPSEPAAWSYRIRRTANATRDRGRDR